MPRAIREKYIAQMEALILEATMFWRQQKSDWASHGNVGNHCHTDPELSSCGCSKR